MTVPSVPAAPAVPPVPSAAPDRAERRRRLETRATSQAFWSALGMVWTIGLWFWAIFTVVQVVATSLLARFLESQDGEIVISVGPVGAPQVFLFVMGSSRRPGSSRSTSPPAARVAPPRVAGCWPPRSSGSRSRWRACW
ncbi:hypothetical protein C8046_05660 [Serinibacter arcticus]|uniref:Uncharacterized protein n=1 Tax=Serinibacter arcticus TaxID=1655435 RepID=A0A2U1ZTB9_9MICO|nr:hypothetical protein [Serinibacter arcticus]PWD50226.1 hypothetical protein C8046_05660 [Serinibacter arcticus]